MSERKSIIPIKNVFYMLCYAWNVLSFADDINVGSDDYDDAYNLLSRVFSFGVSKLIRSGFHRSYINNSEELSTLRGKVNIKESINHLTFLNKKLVCEFDEYSTNDVFNQIIRYTLNSLIKNNAIDKGLKKELIKQNMFFVGIKPTAPTKDILRKISFNRNNIVYKLLINIAIMLYNNTTINEENGTDVFKDFFRSEQMSRVFELFLLNFYSSHLDTKNYKVHSPKIKWHIDKNADQMWEGIFEIDEDIGDRRTDIVIENKELNLQIIIDAKYYQKTLVNAYMGEEETNIRTSHLNQLRGYVIDSDYQGNKIGALIYPMTTHDLSEGVIRPIEGTPITIKTINLNDEWRNIEEDLMKFVRKFEEAYSRVN